MIREVHTDWVDYREPPGKFEAGTPNIAGAFGLSVAADYLGHLGWDAIADHERTLQRHFLRAAKEAFGDRLKVFGPPKVEDREAVLSFSLSGVHPHDVSSIVDAEGVAIRSGHHCAQPLMERLKVPALSRASPYVYNSTGDLDRLVVALGKVAKLFEAPAPRGA